MARLRIGPLCIPGRIQQPLPGSHAECTDDDTVYMRDPCHVFMSPVALCGLRVARAGWGTVGWPTARQEVLLAASYRAVFAARVARDLPAQRRRRPTAHCWAHWAFRGREAGDETLVP